MSRKGYRYCVSLVDHKTRYIWFYHMHLKSDVATIFSQFKCLAENLFQTSIKTIYTYGVNIKP